MKRIIFIAALLIAAATGARAQEKDNLKIIDFDYRRYFDIDYFLYDINQDGIADDNEIFMAGDGAITAYIDHSYYGDAGNITTLEVVVKKGDAGMVLRGSIDHSRLSTYDKDNGTYYQCGDSLNETAFVIVRGDKVGQKNILMIFNIGAFPPVSK